MKTRAKLKEIEPQYNELVKNRGATIENVIRIGRHERMHYLLEDADFSQYRIKKLIMESEEDAKTVLQERELTG